MDKGREGTTSEKKKDYSVPRLTEFGSLRDLTGGGTGEPDDLFEGSTGGGD